MRRDRPAGQAPECTCGDAPARMLALLDDVPSGRALVGWCREFVAAEDAVRVCAHVVEPGTADPHWANDCAARTRAVLSPVMTLVELKRARRDSHYYSSGNSDDVVELPRRR